MRPRCDGRALPSTWLYSIARNTCLSALRAESYRRTIALDEVDDPANVDPSADTFVRSLLTRLPEDQRRAITLFYWEDKSVKEVACILDAPEGTVKSLLHRARRALGEMMESSRCPRWTCDDVQRALLETLDERAASSLEPRSPLISSTVRLYAHRSRATRARRHADCRPSAAAASSVVPCGAVSANRCHCAVVKEDALPDILHLASCAIVTAVSASMLPEYAPVIVATGTVATVMSHLLLAIMRDTLDESAP